MTAFKAVILGVLVGTLLFLAGAVKDLSARVHRLEAGSGPATN